MSRDFPVVIYIGNSDYRRLQIAAYGVIYHKQYNRTDDRHNYASNVQAPCLTKINPKQAKQPTPE